MIKYIFFPLAFLYCIAGFAQPVKDSLLAKDYKQVEDRLTVMHYLDHMATTYYDKHPEVKKGAKDSNFINYYNGVIVSGNPVVSIAVPEYLGYANNEVPLNGTDFFERVAEKNIQSLVSIIETYGYPSASRVKVNVAAKKNMMASIFVSRTDKGDDKLKKLIKPELKSGNISENEYDTLKFFMSKRK